ncbi:DNA-binding protein, partial [Streptococcus agalactiae]|nr:DNA-binding protein [Streptococcus agalactiae]
AYWHARSAINHIHDKNDYGTVQVAICLDDEDQNLELTLNSLISAGDFIKSKWTTNHFQMLEHLILQDNYQEQFQHQKLAQLENIEPSALTKRLKASGLKIYLRTRTQAADLLVKSCTQTKGGSYDF